MPEDEGKLTPSASEEIFVQIEEGLEPGPIRDLWWSLRSELADGGPDAVRTYLELEYQRRKAIVQGALEELSDQLESIN